MATLVLDDTILVHVGATFGRAILIPTEAVLMFNIITLVCDKAILVPIGATLVPYGTI
jgi:hypothetical protein